MYFKYTDNYEVYDNIDYKDIVIINSFFIVESIKSSNFFNSSIKSMTNNIIILCMRYHEMILKNKEVTSFFNNYRNFCRLLPFVIYIPIRKF